MPTPPDLEYRLITDDTRREVPVWLEPDSQRIRVAPDFEAPDWARLEHRQCSHCPLDPAEHRYCPIALNLAYLLPTENLGTSFDTLTLEVATPQRLYRSDTTLQRALSSLFGLVCALSDCPHTRFLRPMALFHLPVATETETLVRAASLWLLGRYLEHRHAPEVPIDLDGLDRAYLNLNELNRCFVERFRADKHSDAPVNAIVLLQMLARGMNWELDDELEAIAPLFD